MEIWKRVRLKYPCNQKYFVSNLGRIKSKSKRFGERIISGKSNSGNCRVVDYRSSEDKSLKSSFNVAREIYKAFIGKLRPNEMIALNSPSLGLHARNLVSYTRPDFGRLSAKYLPRDREMGLITNAKISPDQVKQIRQSRAKNIDIAITYGISAMQVTRIKRGECWATIE